jgi:hypothetical protein
MKGHMQRACFKRKAAGAPCVDQFGNPLPGESINGVASQQQFEQWQQQQHLNASPYTPHPQHYAQMGAPGGWERCGHTTRMQIKGGTMKMFHPVFL